MTTNIENNKSSDAPEPSGDNRDALYLAFIQIRNSELAAHWMRYNFQFSVNFGLLAVVLTTARHPFVAAHLHLIAILGIELTLIWFLLGWQSKKVISRRWEQHLRTYEDTIARPEHRLFQRIANEENKKSWWRRNWQNLNLLTWALPSICLLGWCFLFASKKVG